MKPEAILEVENYAVNQSITTLRNRVNELGVAEPVVQREGKNRILVELPGVQDTTMAKRILGSTATLEFRLVSTDGQGETFHYRDDPNRTIRLQRQVIVTGNQVVGAISGIDPQTSGPEINVTLDSRGGSAMGRLTSQNVGRQMAVLYIEHRTKVEKRMIDGQQQEVPITKVEKGVISVATIQGQFASRFRITGLSSMAEASETALLLRSGALPAPIYIVGERVVGPSLGADNIRMGILSAEIGLLLVIVFMVVLYKLFGLIANLALLLNMVLVIAAMSLLGFTLTLPGIAGMVLTLGMAVDANVLIFSRIKEEMANGMPVQSAIDAGYKRAFVSILDSNLTTLLVAVILFAIGTGPIKGFAITLGIGLIFSMFTAITVTRAVVNLCFGGRQLKRLPI
jgi:preprotein translocase subunit SecD